MFNGNSKQISKHSLDVYSASWPAYPSSDVSWFLPYEHESYIYHKPLKSATYVVFFCF